MSKEEVKTAESDSASTTSSDSSTKKYGYGSCKPGFLQCGNNAKGFLACYCFFVIVQGMLVNGFVNVGISSIEKRFGLKSSETAVVAVGYDIAFCVCTLFVTYAWSQSHRPRIVGIGCVIMAIGAVVFTLPHFTTGPYEYSDNFTETCTSSADSIDCDSDTYLHNYLYVFILGQLLHGIGCTPLYTLGLSFIEDSVPKQSASLYLGIGNGASIFGPVLGYGLGGVFLSYYVDFDSVDVQNEISLTSSDPRWVGAWWLGIIISAVLALLIAIPLFGFPSKFKKSDSYKKTRVSEVHQDSFNDVTNEEDFGKSFKDFPRALLLLARNPTYVFVSLAGATEAMLIAGFTTFLPKIIENQFQQSAGTAALVAGVISIPGGVLGHILAGLVVKGLKLKTANILKFNCLYGFLVICGAPILYLYCQNRSIAGITVPYYDTTRSSLGSLESVCNQDCNCQQEYFIAVCGDDNITYFTACQAGCTSSYENEDGSKMFTGCSCINSTTQTAVSGTCEENCNSLPVFLGVFFVVVMFTFMSSTPSLVVTFRVVPSKLRSFALGMQWLVIRALGSIPGPIMFGTVIDAVCVLWQKRRCDNTQGSCWVYDSDKLFVNVLVICCVVKICSIILFSIACYLYKPPEVEHDEDKKSIVSSETTDNDSFENSNYHTQL